MDLDTVIQRAKRKDSKAFEMLYRTYYPKMVGICMNLIKEDRATVDDLVHDAFIMAFVSIGSLRDNNKFCEWLTSIVRNVSLKHIEQRKRIHVQPLSSINEEDTALIDPSSSPDSDLNHKELLKLISLLPPGYSKILRLSVIEGFSHKEIAEMLGIEPHSSSSQLSRARHMLKRILGNRIVSAIAILLLPFLWYVLFRHEEKQLNEEAIADTKQNEQTMSVSKKSSPKQRNKSASPHALPVLTNNNIEASEAEDSVLKSDADTSVINTPSKIDNEFLITKSIEDSLDTNTKKTITRIAIQPEIKISTTIQKKRIGFAVGSVGPALVQSVYQLIAAKSSTPSKTDSPIPISSDFPEPDSPAPLEPDTPVAPEPEAPSYEVPNPVTTWEDYGKYLNTVSPSDAPADTLALIEIANHNAGEIEQKEHHDKPITFGISLTKSLGQKWSVETGLQYSILNSQFSMGENGYAVTSKQKIHYLGLPLRVSYLLIDYKRLSAYNSVGITMHIPVYGKLNSSYLVNWNNAYSEEKPVTTPLQWQASFSLGLQYEFFSNTSLFVEPTFNWFIPSGSETHTIWTEHPFIFTCPFGIRITW